MSTASPRDSKDSRRESNWKEGKIDDTGKRIVVMKMLVVGDSGVGKSSLIKRYVYGKFSASSRPTIGVDFAVKMFNYDVNTTVKIQLWDIAGQERYGHMTRVYYKDSMGALLLFDTNSLASFQNLAKWKQDIDAKVFLKNSNDPIPVVVLANKFDLWKKDGFYVEEREKMDEYCKEHGFIGWTETSAKNEEFVENIDKAVRLLIDHIVNKGEFGPPSDPATRLGSTSSSNDGSNNNNGVLTGSMVRIDLADEKKAKKCCKKVTNFHGGWLKNQTGHDILIQRVQLEQFLLR